MKIFILSFILFFMNSEFIKSQTYLALGDSYTIGEAVDQNESWPHQLTAKLIERNVVMKAPQIIAKTGWTTDELISAVESAHLQETYDLVSLSIGVNNQYRGYPIAQFKKEYLKLLKIAVNKANDKPERVIVLSIPDYGVTPFAKEKDPQKISKEIDLYNAIMKEITEDNGVSFYDVSEISRQALNNHELLANDGLHPSGKMYGLWVDEILKDVAGVLKDEK